MADDGSALILVEAQRGLTRQEASLDSVRGRSVTLLATGSVVSGLATAGLLVRHPSAWHTAVACIALAFFVATVALALWINRTQTFKFSSKLGDYLEMMRAGNPPTTLDVTYNISKDMESWRQSNAKKIQDLYELFTVLCALTGIEVLAWAIAAL